MTEPSSLDELIKTLTKSGSVTSLEADSKPAQPPTLANSRPTSPQALEIPKPTPYWIQAQYKTILETIAKLQQQGERVNILVSGKQGSGKSELVNQYAAKYQRPLATLEIGRLSEVGQIFGYMDLKNGATTYIEGLFLKAIKTPYAVIHLQELNRPENDTTLNSIFSVLDDTSRGLWIEELAAWVPVAEGVVIFATINEGFEFIGTQPLDLALRNRFHAKIELGELHRTQEAELLSNRTGIDPQTAEQIMDMVVALRHHNQNPLWVSVRDTINISRFVRVGLPIEAAIVAVLGSSQELLESFRLSSHLYGDNSNSYVSVTNPYAYVQL